VPENSWNKIHSEHLTHNNTIQCSGQYQQNFMLQYNRSVSSCATTALITFHSKADHPQRRYTYTTQIIHLRKITSYDNSQIYGCFHNDCWQSPWQAYHLAPSNIDCMSHYWQSWSVDAQTRHAILQSA